MKVAEQVCRSCGVELTAGAIEGFCQRCLAAVAFGQDNPDSARPDAPLVRRLGDYELLEEIGRGGMGIVYRARQIGLGREVALKLLRGGPFASAKEIHRFRREATAAAGLRHPNIVAVHEVGEAEGHLFFSMDLVQGPTLADLTRETPLDPRRAARYTRSIAQAISVAHARGILHRDLKPLNVIIDSEDQPRVTDFGIARRLDLQDATITQRIVGSPSYIPPEQADPQLGPPTIASDVYSLGALLYHLLVARPPFTGATITATLTQVLDVDPIPPRRLNPSVPRDLETICLKCLHKDPARRMPSAMALAEDLSAFLENRPIKARPVSILEKFVLWVRRRPAIAGLTAALGLALALGASGVVWEWRENQTNLYAADLHVASEAIRVGDLGRARDLLAEHVPRNDGDFAWRFLNAEAVGDPRTVLGFHPWIVCAVAWSSDGRWLLSGSVGSGTIGADIRLWDMLSDSPEGPIITTNGVRQLAWFPDNRRFLASHFDGRVRIWDAFTRTELASYTGRSAQLSADGRYLLTCEAEPFGWDKLAPSGPVTRRNLESGTMVSLPEARLAALAPSGRFVALTDFKDSITIRDAESGELLCSLDGGGPLWTLVFSPDEKALAATGFTTDVRLWRLDGKDPRPLRLQGHTLNTWSAAFSPDGTRLVTTASDQTLRVWNVSDGSALNVLRGHGSEVWCAAFSPDGERIASGGKDRAVIVWSESSSFGPPDYKSFPDTRPVISADAQWLITQSPENPELTVVYDTRAAGPPRHVFAGQPLAVDDERGQWLSRRSGFEMEWMRLSDLEPERRIELANDPDEPAPEWWTASSGGEFIAGMARTGRVSLWNARSGARTRSMVVKDALPSSLQLSPDAHWLAITAGEQGFWLCSLEKGSARRLKTHKDQGKWAAFSPDNQVLATASVDATIKLWNVASGRELATLHGHRTEVTAVAFAPDGEILASCESGLGLRLWHLPTRREIAVIDLPEVADWLEFSSNDRALAVGTTGGRVRLLAAP